MTQVVGPRLSDTQRSVPSDRWRKALLPSDASVRDAITCLDDTALQIALVVSSDGTLLGTLTDGDIRRGLLRGLGLSDAIETMVNREPLVAPPTLGAETVL